MKKQWLAAVLAVILIWSCCVSPCFAVVTEDAVKQTRATVSQGMKNIVKRAYQMTNIQWTPKADIAGWGNGLTYKKGTTYTGLPYGQPVYADYVP